MKLLRGEKGMAVADIARTLGKGRSYVRARLKAALKEAKRGMVAFDVRRATNAGVLQPSKIYPSGGPRPNRNGRMIRGEIVGQVSKNVFVAKAEGTVFQVNKKFLEWLRSKRSSYPILTIQTKIANNRA